MNPLIFSIIIPCFNSSQTIKRAIDSVINQVNLKNDFFNESIEIIIVDDVSDDVEDLEKKIKSYKSSNIKLIKLKSKSYGGGSRNIGVENSKGKYIAFLDSDDEFYLDKFEHIIKHISEEKDDLFIYSKVNSCYSDKKKENNIPDNAIDNESVSEYLFLNKGVIQTSSIVISRKLFDKCRFNPTYIRHQDYDLCFKVGHELGTNNFIFIDKPLVYWYQSKSTGAKKGANIEFINKWLKENELYFTEDSYKGYMYNVYLPLIIENKKIKLFFKLAFKYRKFIPLIKYRKFIVSFIRTIRL